MLCLTMQGDLDPDDDGYCNRPGNPRSVTRLQGQACIAGILATQMYRRECHAPDRPASR